MSNGKHKLLLVGDNPFHGISHLSQERARNRGERIVLPADRAADTVLAAIDNGADGFSFSVSDHTVSILRTLRENGTIEKVPLYAMMPYAFEYVRVATRTGTPGLVKKFAQQILLSGDVETIFRGLLALPGMNLEGFVKTYLSYEISRIEASTRRQGMLTSVLLNEVIADMGLALDLEWLFRSFIVFLTKRGIKPGFNTRNFPYFVRKFEEWGLNLDNVFIVTPFNKAGFQMNPSRDECEETLESLASPNVLAISVLAAGYLSPLKAAEYLASFDNLNGLIVGVSNEQQARETFKVFNDRLR